MAYKNWESVAVDVLWVLSTWAACRSSSPSSTLHQSPLSSSSGGNGAPKEGIAAIMEEDSATPSAGRKQKHGKCNEGSVRGRKCKQ